MTEDFVCDHIGADILRWQVARAVTIQFQARRRMLPHIYKWAAWGNMRKLMDYIKKSERRNPVRKCRGDVPPLKGREARWRSLRELARTLPEVPPPAPPPAPAPAPPPAPARALPRFKAYSLRRKPLAQV
jgi:hypothetical protein